MELKEPRGHTTARTPRSHLSLLKKNLLSYLTGKMSVLIFWWSVCSFGAGYGLGVDSPRLFSWPAGHFSLPGCLPSPGSLQVHKMCQITPPHTPTSVAISELQNPWEGRVWASLTHQVISKSWIYSPQCGFTFCTHHALKKTLWNNSQKLKIYFTNLIEMFGGSVKHSLKVISESLKKDAM